MSNFITTFKTSNSDWNNAITGLKQLNLTMIEGINENNSIIKWTYDDTRTEKEIYSHILSSEGILAMNDDQSYITDNPNDIYRLLTPILQQYMTKIKTDITDINNKTVFFLIRFSSSEIKAGVAEGWHHDYMWAPASYSSLIYLQTAKNKESKADVLTTANFCSWEFNKSATTKN